MLVVRERKCINEYAFCTEHGRQFLEDFDVRRKSFGATGKNQYQVFDIELIVLEGNQDMHRIYLREIGAHDRCIRLNAGVFETSTLYWNFKPMQFPRPMTHDIVAAVIKTLGGDLRDVLIYELTPQELVYKAYLRISRDDQLFCVDVRPSDAINVAVLAGAPIYISEDVLTIAAQHMI